MSQEKPLHAPSESISIASEPVDESEHPHKGLRRGESMISGIWEKLKASLFPYLIFRHPEHKPFRYIARLYGSITHSMGNAMGGSRPLPRLFTQSLSFGMKLFGALFAVSFIVYICFSFNGDELFPSVGEGLFYVLIARNVFLIALMHYLCFTLSKPNFERIRLLTNLGDQNDENLHYIGLFHSIRRLLWRPSRFRVRWFTTYLSDSFLLTVTYIFYIVYGIMLIIDSDDLFKRIADGINIYRGCLTCGFIVYSLEFAPIVSAKYRSQFNAACSFVIAMQISDFFLFVFDKQGQTPVVRAFGAGAQLFITHSSVLLSAIIGQHHRHAHLSADFPLRSVWKILFVLAVAGVWLVYAIYRDMYGHGSEGEHHDNWVPVSYPYVIWGISVVGGLLCIGAAWAYCYVTSGRRRPQKKLGRGLSAFMPADELTEEGPKHTEVGHKHKEEEEEEESDFDIALIVISFTVSAVYFSSEIFGAFSLSEWWTMSYWISTPLAPIGLGVLAATLWWNPPSSPHVGLYFGLLLASVCLLNVEMAEDCHLNSNVPACCEYPWLPDVNHHLEELNEVPECATFVNKLSGQCVAPLSPNSAGAADIFLVFTSVTEVVQAMRINVFGNDGALLFTEDNTDTDLVVTVSCQEQTIDTDFFGVLKSVPPGCYGKYMYKFPDSVAEICASAPSCTASVSSLNCAFMPSEYLEFEVVNMADPLTDIAFTSPIVGGKDTVDSSFYSVFRMVGMAALIECFFTLFGVLLKLIFIAECKSKSVKKSLIHARPAEPVAKEIVNKEGTLEQENTPQETVQPIEETVSARSSKRSAKSSVKLTNAKSTTN